MVCYYRSSFLDLPVALVDCQVEGCASRLHHFCQGGYVAMHDIDLDGAERKIYLDFVHEIQMGGKPEKLNKVVHSTVYSMDESEEGEEDVEGAVLGGGGEYVSIVPVVYPRGTVSVSSIGFYSIE